MLVTSFYPRTLLAVSLVLTPFGGVDEHLNGSAPWFGFFANDPILLVARAQRVTAQESVPKTIRSQFCETWISALQSLPVGMTMGLNPTQKIWSQAWREWEPWTKEDLTILKDCEELPCDVKLNGAEVSQMRSSPENSRKETFLSLIISRADHYERTQERKEYEFTGDPIDPWIYLETSGFRSKAVKPTKPRLWIRRLDFEPGKMKPIRQVLDRRFAISKRLKNTQSQASLWIRDAYTSHYFDSWGEWTNLECALDGASVVVTQALVVELDLLKKKGLIDQLVHGKMREAFEKQGRKYLDHIFAELYQASTSARSRPEIPKR